jgi:putative oxidoreductase
MFHRLVSTTNDFSWTVARFVLGVVFFAHGAQKMLGMFGGRGFSGTVDLYSQMGFSTPVAVLAMAAEFFGGLALMAGFLSRIAALGIIGKMLVAIFTLHMKNGFFMNWSGEQRGEGIEYHLLVLALGLVILIKGSGALSVDQYLTRSTAAQRT